MHVYSPRGGGGGAKSAHHIRFLCCKLKKYSSSVFYMDLIHVYIPLTHTLRKRSIVIRIFYGLEAQKEIISQSD